MLNFNRIFIIICFLVIWSSSIAQEPFMKFKLIAEVEIPKELKYGNPSNVIVDFTKNILIVNYDYKPTYLAFYSLDDSKLKKLLKIKGHVYLYSSYFDLKNDVVYIDRGGVDNYESINLITFKTQKVSGKSSPPACNLVSISGLGNKIIKHNKSKCWIYLLE